MSHIRELFGDNVKRYRRMKKWTQAELGERIGTEPSAVQRWEAGTRWPAPEQIDALVEAFGLRSPAALFAGPEAPAAITEVPKPPAIDLIGLLDLLPMDDGLRTLLKEIVRDYEPTSKSDRSDDNEPAESNG